LLLDLKVGASPVVEQDKLVGVITVSDILAVFLELAGAARLASPWKWGWTPIPVVHACVASAAIVRGHNEIISAPGAEVVIHLADRPCSVLSIRL
jgi:bacteriorhodopsin